MKRYSIKIAITPIYLMEIIFAMGSIVILGLPIFAFDVLYNRVATQEKAYYFKDAIGLEALLRNLETKELKRIASDMKDIACRGYVWEIISQKYAQIF